MVRAKRKREEASEKPTVESPPRKKKARRIAKPPIVPVQDSDVGATESSPKVSKRARRVKPPSPVARQDSDAEEGSDAVGSPMKRRIRRKVEVLSDSGEEAGLKRLRRAKSSPVDVDSDSPSRISSGKGRLRHKPDLEEVKVPAEYILDSDDDPEELALPVQPTTSRPTKKQLKSNALERYAKARKTKGEGSDGSDEEEEPDNLEESFIVDEEDADDDANAALDLMRYSHRELDEHLAVFVEYIIALHSDPDHLSTASDDEKQYFDTAVVALRRHIDPLADSIIHSNWKAPFIATLNLRPLLADGVSSDGDGDCHACWTRGRYACDISGSYALSTKKGIYDHSTFQDMPEKKVRYGKATTFGNNAEAPNLPYPPRFELVIGTRCFNRALAYHEARHYLYSVSLRVKEKIQSLCEESAELADDPNALLQAMKDENFIASLWDRLKSAKKQWAIWANRKDHDSLM
ncbi:hypothetical protein C8R43DRAFT_1121453 [Mycena crocata]|nr:hypothetical protein C8R43DRAFT_1121453 [Mycena crocata]